MRKKLVSKLGISKTGSDVNVFDRELCDRIRERLKMTKKELSNRAIQKITIMSNNMIANFILENPEGFMLEVGKKPFGVIAVSKHLPKEFRDDKDEMVEFIKSLDVSDLHRKQLLKKYDVTIDKTLDLNKLSKLKEKIPHLNLNTFFYKYRFIWFNKKNCSSKKAGVYKFQPSRINNKKLSENIFSGKDYFEWNFHNFYKYRIKSEF